MNQLIIHNSFSFFLGTNAVPVRTHGHPSIQFVISTSQPFKSKNAKGEWEEKRGLLISPNLVHECDAQHIEIISIDIDPESALGEWVLGNFLSTHKIVEYPSDKIPALSLGLLSDYIENRRWEDLINYVFNYFNFKPTASKSERDTRIARVLSNIKEEIHSEITTSGLAEVAHLSESRLLHLFKDTVGLPIRNYILWLRLKVAFLAVMEGQSLTEAAYSAGFFDQAHMTKTFVKMMGVSPSTILKNSKFVQVSFYE